MNNKPTQQWLRANRPELATHYRHSNKMWKWFSIGDGEPMVYNHTLGVWIPYPPPTMQGMIKIKPLPKHLSLPECTRESVWGYLEGKDRKTSLLEMVEKAQQYDVVVERNKELVNDVCYHIKAADNSDKLRQIEVDASKAKSDEIDHLELTNRNSKMDIIRLKNDLETLKGNRKNTVSSLEAIIINQENTILNLSRSVVSQKRNKRNWQLAFWCSVAALIFSMVAQ